MKKIIIFTLIFSFKELAHQGFLANFRLTKYPFSINLDPLKLKKSPGTNMEPLTLGQFKQMLLSTSPSVVILDVRTQEEHFDKRIRGAMNIPLDKLPELYKTVPKTNTLVVHCAHGFRAKRAAEYLEEALHLKVYYLKGDIENWEHMELDVLYEDET
jgi:rhodanese-related sulfurtransferase